MLCAEGMLSQTWHFPLGWTSSQADGRGGGGVCMPLPWHAWATFPCLVSPPTPLKIPLGLCTTFKACEECTTHPK